MEQDYYLHKVNVQIVSRVSERIKAYNVKKLGSLKKAYEMFRFNGE